jgi:uncharacterized protein (TIGR02147 family)
MPSRSKTAADFLRAQYEERKKKNSRYSLRAYAKLLGISSGRLSEVLSKKSLLGYRTATKITAKLDLTTKEKSAFLAMVESELFNNNRKRYNRKAPSRFRQMPLEEFSIVSDWEYFAMLALIDTKSFKSDESWISKKMGLPVSRVEKVLGDLKSMDLIQTATSGVITTTHNEISTLTDVPSEVLRKSNIDAIQRGVDKIAITDVLLRDVTSLTIPVSLSKIREVKAVIQQCKMKIMKLMDEESTTDVYNLNIQFVPVTDTDVK